MSNKLFISSNVLKNQSVSKVKYTREYLISNEIADELNMYNTFGIFSSFNDVYEPKYNHLYNTLFGFVIMYHRLVNKHLK